jgi:hypothetical protein
MKLKPKIYFLIAIVSGITFFALVYLKIEFMTYGFLGVSIGGLIRGFIEQSKLDKEEINNKT